jgi:hypothetical protein
MNDHPHDPPRWVRAVLGRPASREGAVFLLLGWVVLTLLAALVPIVAALGSLRDGWATTWTTTDSALTVLAAVFVVLDVWTWLAIRRTDRHGLWPAEEHTYPAHG